MSMDYFNIIKVLISSKLTCRLNTNMIKILKYCKDIWSLTCHFQIDKKGQVTTKTKDQVEELGEGLFHQIISINTESQLLIQSGIGANGEKLTYRTECIET